MKNEGVFIGTNTLDNNAIFFDTFAFAKYANKFTLGGAGTGMNFHVRKLMENATKKYPDAIVLDPKNDL